MAWRDLIDNIDMNSLDERSLRKIVSTLSSVANKRLRRMEEKGIKYSSERGADTIAGKRKFSSKDKKLGQLRSEFTRVVSFLQDKMSTLSGRVKEYKQHREKISGRKYTVKEAREEYYSEENKRKPFNRYMDLWSAIRHDSRFMRERFDSKQIDGAIYRVSSAHDEDYPIDKMVDEIYEFLMNEREESKRKWKEAQQDISSFF